jgi:hypothetical protein
LIRRGNPDRLTKPAALRSLASGATVRFRADLDALGAVRVRKAVGTVVLEISGVKAAESLVVQHGSSLKSCFP